MVIANQRARAQATPLTQEQSCDSRSPRSTVIVFATFNWYGRGPHRDGGSDCFCRAVVSSPTTPTAPPPPGPLRQCSADPYLRRSDHSLRRCPDEDRAGGTRPVKGARRPVGPQRRRSKPARPLQAASGPRRRARRRLGRRAARRAPRVRRGRSRPRVTVLLRTRREGVRLRPFRKK